MEMFVIVSAFFPQYSRMLFIAYIIVTIAVIVLMTGRSAGKIIREIEDIMDGEIIVNVKRESILKLQSKDPEYSKEMRKGLTRQLYYFILMILLLMLFNTPYPRILVSLLVSSIGIKTPVWENFMYYQFLYLLFYLISMIGYRGLSKLSPQQEAMIISPTQYTITSKGMVLDNRTPLKFPLKISSYRVNNKRKFLELEILQYPMPMASNVPVRIRLYSNNPRELLEKIKDKIVVEKGLTEKR